jgi:hypothetical protein
MRKKALTFTLLSAFLLSTMCGTSIVKPVNANPIPSPYTEIVIESPKNTTYNGSTVFLNIHVDTTYSYSFFYSVDGQEMKPLENITVISSTNINAGKNPPIYRTVLNGSTLINISEGKHNITVCQINPNTQYEVGRAVAIFEIDPNSDNIPEFPSWLILPLFLLATSFVIVIKRNSHS